MQQLFGRVAEVHGQLSRIGLMRNRIDREEVKWLVEAVRLKLHREVGLGSMVEYGEKVLGHSLRVAQERVRTATQLLVLPVTCAAMETGELSWTAGRHLTRFVLAADEAEWVEHLEGKSAPDIEEACRGRQPGDKPNTPRDERHRKFGLELELSGDQMAVFRAAAAKIIEEAGKSVDDEDVLAILARSYLTPASPVVGGSRTVQTQLTMEQCSDCARGWDTSSGDRIELDEAAIGRRLCDPKVVGGHERGADVMSIPEPLRRAVRARDGHRCTVPGCRNKKFLELHHLLPVSEGGRHTMENLTTLCGAHHDAHHKGLLLITGRAGIDLEFEHVDPTPRWIREKFGLGVAA